MQKREIDVFYQIIVPMLFVNLNIAIYLGYFGYKKRLIGFVVLINEEKRKLIETKRGGPPFSVQ